MNELIISEISKELGLNKKHIETVLLMLEEGNTIPFIARYRKEKTGSMDEENIRTIHEKYMYQVNLTNRKEDVIRLIDEKGMLTEELKNSINACTKLVDVEDLYRPYKEKKKTLATIAISNGLEPLAKLILEFKETPLNELAKNFVKEELTINDCLTGAGHIISEMISDEASYRKWIRAYTYNNGLIVVKKKKSSEDPKKVYEMYYDFSEPVKKIKPHRILAINRAEKEKIVTVNVSVSEEIIYDYINRREVKVLNESGKFITDCIVDAYKRLIKPSIEREIRSDLTVTASDEAINSFGINLEKLLLTPPLKEKIVMGFDPAFRTGCKLAILDQTGQCLDIAVIYPHEPVNKKEEAKKIVIDLINKYNVDIIAIGNGTASRESEIFVSEVIKGLNKKVEYIIVNEAGASIYSASKLAIEEFPELTVEKRSAISIGRRLQDPLSELVKIDPESIGVGLYQHDLASKKLTESLDFVVSKTVNSVGVNINTSSKSLLKYVSGLTKKNIDNIIEYRNKNGKIDSRDILFKKKLLNDKTYLQAVGFLRINDGSNKLDETAIHPESYDKTMDILKDLNLKIEDIGTKEMSEALTNFDIDKMSKKYDIDIYTLKDIVDSLLKPSRDPRDSHPKPILKSDILDIKDLHIGDELEGTVRNVLPFGAFIDIGLHNDGLVHISKLSNSYVKDPTDIVNVGDIVKCYVIDINLETEKVALSLIK